MPANWMMVPALIPLLLIRFVGDAWHHHYMAPVTACLFMCCVPGRKAALSRGFALASILLTVLAAGSSFVDAARFYSGRHGDAFYRPAPGRLASLRTARERLLADAEGDALVEGNLVPLLVTRPRLFQLGGAQTSGSYRFVLVEKPPYGDPWPLSHERVGELIDLWRRQEDAEVLLDDEHVFFATTSSAFPSASSSRLLPRGTSRLRRASP
jgi:hypothetical protein